MWRAALLAIALAGCDTASAELGRDAWLQIAGAQWAPGSPPAARGGPSVAAIVPQRQTFTRDTEGQRVSGGLAAGATAAWIGLEGDRGGWIVVAGPPSVDTPELPSLTVQATITAEAPLGPATLLAVAVDENAHAGDASSAALFIED